MPAVVVAAIIGAASTATAAGLQYKAAKGAQKTQETASDKALALEKTSGDRTYELAKTAAEQAQSNLEAARKNLAETSKSQGEIYKQQVQNLSPFTSLGNAAAGTLGDMMGFPVSMPQAVPISTPAYAPLPTISAPKTGSNYLTPNQPGNAAGIVENSLGAPLTNPSRSTMGAGSVPTGTGAVPRATEAPAAASEVAPGNGTLGDIGSPQASAQIIRGSSYTMQSPDGETANVPAELVAHYKSLGGVVIGAVS